MRALLPFTLLFALACSSPEDEDGAGGSSNAGKGGSSSGASGTGAAGGRSSGGSGGGGSGASGGSKASGGSGGAAGGTGGASGASGTSGSSATGGDGGSGASGGASGAGADAGSSGDSGAGTGGGGPVPTSCEALDPVATDSPDRVVGDGTPGSCTAEALADAATAGGVVTFDCGPDPLTITVDSTVVFTKESVLDGGGLVTLSGGGNARILYLDSGYDQTTPRLTVQRLTFTEGNVPDDGGDDTALGGGAIYRDGGSLTVIDCDFLDNHAPATGQDLAGGAIYAFGGGETVISGSTFSGNSASDGGAIGSLNGHVKIIDSVITDNAATGTDGNPGNGGCGGGLYMDGGDEDVTLCGVVIANNTAGAIAGGVFRVSNSHDGTGTIDKSTISGNQVTPTDDGNAGGLYLEGLALTMSATTISGNEAFYNGGLWFSTGEGNFTNVTIAENTAFGSNGAGVWLGHDPTGTMLNCTIANNHSTADGQVAGAIFGGGLTLKNTIISGNTAQYTPGCDTKHTSDGGNLQWPDGALCSDAPTVADPELAELAHNGGPTETLMPSASSPAIGLGTDCPPTDQRGEPRGEPCTAGAVEAP